MSVNALKAQGTKLQMAIGSPTDFQDIAEIISFNGPAGSAPVIDVTDLSSAAKEKRLGLNDNGQLSFECNFLPADTGHAALKTAKEAGTLCHFKLVFTDTPATTWTFTAFVMSLAVSGAVDGVVKASVSLEISGTIDDD